jgi:hypothetical protein
VSKEPAGPQKFRIGSLLRDRKWQNSVHVVVECHLIQSLKERGISKLPSSLLKNKLITLICILSLETP